ncbi:MAG TPA: hypothetical protein VFN28_16395 [Amaricoccus sp.]|nr:hypothetical protein [Amaricoccus sp.]
MSPSQDREHPAPDGDALRPGGGTYPVRAAVSPRQPQPPPAPPREPPREPRARPARPSRRGSPGALVALLLGIFALLSFGLLVVALVSYLPNAPDEAPATVAPAGGGTSP